jgi:hypothetical protein
MFVNEPKRQTGNWVETKSILFDKYILRRSTVFFGSVYKGIINILKKWKSFLCHHIRKFVFLCLQKVNGKKREDILTINDQTNPSGIFISSIKAK